MMILLNASCSRTTPNTTSEGRRSFDNSLSLPDRLLRTGVPQLGYWRLCKREQRKPRDRYVEYGILCFTEISCLPSKFPASCVLMCLTAPTSKRPLPTVRAQGAASGVPCARARPAQGLITRYDMIQAEKVSSFKVLCHLPTLYSGYMFYYSVRIRSVRSVSVSRANCNS